MPHFVFQKFAHQLRKHYRFSSGTCAAT